MDPVICVIGVGYVGLPTAVAFAQQGLQVIGFDKNDDRVTELNQGVDNNHQCINFAHPNLVFTSVLTDIAKANFYLISVPTAVNEHYVPNIFPIKCAAKDIGSVIKKGDVVVLESTVFPGATRELLIPILEEISGLHSGRDFYVGYSSERIDPGNENQNLSNIYKVISGQNKQALSKIENLYSKIYKGRLHCAPTMEVAESSKLLENIQRDVNIALMNEYAQILHKMDVSIHDVLQACATKWNFLPFKPGLVGGHCIPEDPYYLIYQANKQGAIHNLVSCARQTNEQFVHFIKDMLIKFLSEQNTVLKNAKVAVMGISYKANVADTRHSLSITLYKLLKEIGIQVYACDPIADHNHTQLNWVELSDLVDFNALIIAQAHPQFKQMDPFQLGEKLNKNGIIMDLANIFTTPPVFRTDILYWRL